MGLASKVGGTRSGYYPGPLSSNYGYPPQLAAAQANQNQAGGGMPAGASASGYGAPTAAPQQQMPYPGQSGPPQPGSRPQSFSGPPGPAQSNASIPYNNPTGAAPPGSSGYGSRPSSIQGPPPGAPPYGAPAQSPMGQQFAPPPGGPPPQQSQQQYGAPPPQQQNYGAAPPQGARPGGLNVQTLVQTLQQCAMEQKVQGFYPPQALNDIAQKVAASGALEKVAQEWRLPMEIAIDLVKIALFDVVLFIDDSGSMSFEEGGSRIDDLKLIMGRVSQIASIFDQDGISVRFMNSRESGDGLRSESDAQNLINRIRFTGLTPFGTQLKQKVIEPMILQPARSGQLRKPVLIISVTDGQPAGEDRYTLFNTIIGASRELARTQYGPDALSIQIAQVGNDIKARQFLEEIDTHPEVGGLVDCTSNYELEADEMLKANPPVDLTPELWLVKLMLGPIDDSYDAQDEQQPRR